MAFDLTLLIGQLRLTPAEWVRNMHALSAMAEGVRGAARRADADEFRVKAEQSLVDKGVEFVIVRGWSAILHGSSYVTNDLDICYSRGMPGSKTAGLNLLESNPNRLQWTDRKSSKRALVFGCVGFIRN